MFSRASSLTVLSRGCRYFLRPNPVQHSPFSLSARSFAAVNAAMADTSGVTADSLKSKLLEQLQAQHVEIEDLSGMWRWQSRFPSHDRFTEDRTNPSLFLQVAVDKPSRP